jgi:NAD(P)-dependent dehydrogenase (short-subunit alcohol dehydrogenase family)
MEKTILVTGASRGIGAATALLAARRGYNVAVNYKENGEAANRVVDQIRREGGHARAYQADIAREREVKALFAAVDQDFGGLAALVNNAGTLAVQSSLEGITAERLGMIFGVNVTGAFLCSREAVLRLSTRHGGTGGAIVNVSSIAARTGAPGEYLDYAASKGALDTFTIGLARELAAEGIRVNAVRPAFIHTEIHARGGEPGRVERLKDTIPMQRGGMPEEVAHAILWLLSGEASYTTGSFIEVSGGR